MKQNYILNILGQDIVDKLSILYERYKDDIYALYLTGSRSLDYITSWRDIDILCFLPSSTDFYKKREIRNKLMDSEECKYLHDKYNVNLLLRVGEDNWGTFAYVKITKIIGKDIVKPCDILNKDKDTYILILKEKLSTIPYSGDPCRFKWLYHILTGIYIISNNSYELTEEQIKYINIIHDDLDPNEYDKCLSFCKEWIKNY